MLEEDNKKVENKKEDVSPQMLEIQQTVQELSTRLEQATTMLSDKDKEIESMRATKVKLIDDKLEQEKDIKAGFGIKNDAKKQRSAEDINSLSNVEIFEVIADVVQTSLEANKTQAETEISHNFKGLESKFDDLTAHFMKSEATAELNQVRSDNKDFDNHKDAIRETLKAHQDFSIQDAYDWVKMKEKKGVIADKHTFSEKPDKDQSTADEAVERSIKQPEGRKISSNRQFKIDLDAAIDKVQAARGGR